MAKLDPASHCKHFQECRRSRGWSQPLTYNGRASLSTTKGRVTKSRVAKATKGRDAGVLTTNRITTLPLALPRRRSSGGTTCKDFTDSILARIHHPLITRYQGGRMVSTAMSDSGSVSCYMIFYNHIKPPPSG